MPYRTLRKIVEHQKILTAAPAKTTVSEAARVRNKPGSVPCWWWKHGRLVVSSPSATHSFGFSPKGLIPISPHCPRS